MKVVGCIAGEEDSTVLFDKRGKIPGQESMKHDMKDFAYLDCRAHESPQLVPLSYLLHEA